jgi:hypothetical protein
MQLNKKKNVKGALFAASCALIANEAGAESWEYDAALMYYGESDSRVTAIEGILNVSKEFQDDRKLKGKLVFDSLTGASANGAVPQQTAQTFTTPSGNGQYQAEAGETPLDDTFKDTRFQFAGQWSQPLGDNYTYSGGANISFEYDYQSIALNSVVGRYFNKKNSTVSLGLSYAFDTIDAVGERPVGLSAMVFESDFANNSAFRAAFDQTRQTGGEDTKDTIDIILGLTQVISKNWITQFNLSFSEVDGYLTDPYKVVSEVDAAGISQRQLYENRPDSRSKQAFFMQSKYHFGSGVWDVSYRFTDDDWDIQSHTLETRYRFLLNQQSYLEPHLRYYRQSEAEFYKTFLLNTEATPEFVSADYRIGKLDTYTVGLKYGRERSNGKEHSVRLEYYRQAPKSIGETTPGVLNQLELFPELDAVIVQYSYEF